MKFDSVKTKVTETWMKTKAWCKKHKKLLIGLGLTAAAAAGGAIAYNKLHGNDDSDEDEVLDVLPAEEVDKIEEPEENCGYLRYEDKDGNLSDDKVPAYESFFTDMVDETKAWEAENPQTD